MNIAYFLLPKSNVAYLYDDYTFRQGLEKMRYHGYTAIPVITRNGTYVGTVSEGDFLWQLLSDETKQQKSLSMKDNIFVSATFSEATIIPPSASLSVWKNWCKAP